MLSNPRRPAFRTGTAVLAAATLVAGLQITTMASASASRPVPGGARTGLEAAMYSPADPYSPTYKHPYRYGAVPSLARLAKMRSWAIAHPSAAPALSASDLSYGGGIDGIGVTTGPQKVYIVFWGSQWGTQGTNAQGDVTLSNDPNGAAPYLQELFKGLGTGNELWSGVLTQYCQGVATGTPDLPGQQPVPRRLPDRRRARWRVGGRERRDARPPRPRPRSAPRRSRPPRTSAIRRPR